MEAFMVKQSKITSFFTNSLVSDLLLHQLIMTTSVRNTTIPINGNANIFIFLNH
jgi:hypothetical protein